MKCKITLPLHQKDCVLDNMCDKTGILEKFLFIDLKSDLKTVKMEKACDFIVCFNYLKHAKIAYSTLYNYQIGKMAQVAVSALKPEEKDRLVCTYAALLLHDGDLEVSVSN